MQFPSNKKRDELQNGNVLWPTEFPHKTVIFLLRLQIGWNVKQNENTPIRLDMIIIIKLCPKRKKIEKSIVPRYTGKVSLFFPSTDMTFHQWKSRFVKIFAFCVQIGWKTVFVCFNSATQKCQDIRSQKYFSRKSCCRIYVGCVEYCCREVSIEYSTKHSLPAVFVWERSEE